MEVTAGALLYCSGRSDPGVRGLKRELVEQNISDQFCALASKLLMLYAGVPIGYQIWVNWGRDMRYAIHGRESICHIKLSLHIKFGFILTVK